MMASFAQGLPDGGSRSRPKPAAALRQAVFRSPGPPPAPGWADAAPRIVLPGARVCGGDRTAELLGDRHVRLP